MLADKQKHQIQAEADLSQCFDKNIKEVSDNFIYMMLKGIVRERGLHQNILHLVRYEMKHGRNV